MIITLNDVNEEFSRSAMAEQVTLPIDTWVAYLNLAQFALSHGYRPRLAPELDTCRETCPRCRQLEAYGCGCTNHEKLSVMVDPRDHEAILSRAENTEAERDAALARVAEMDLIAEMLDAGQGDDDGARIMPEFEEGMTVMGKVEACLHLLERRRDAIAGFTAALTPQPDAGLEALVADMRKEISIASDLLHERWKSQSKAVSRRLEEHHDKTIPAILSALRSRPVGELWQDIATAPKGKRVILGGPVGVQCDDWAEYCRYNGPGFTHWMPLPAAPRIRAALTEGEAG